MILDKLELWNAYDWRGERFEKGFRFLAAMTPDIADGRYAIDGEDVFCSISAYDTAPLEGKEYEAHRQYADIQYMMRGEESILWAPVSGLTVTKPYTPDIEFYALSDSPSDVVLTDGLFCVFFPQDAHAPCITHGQSPSVRKAVVKVRIA